jgi:3-methyladenine DNA glycosylase/8-oxoguanine DNA glycosylase
VEAIVGQQLSTRSAATIRARLESRLGDDPAVDALHRLDDLVLRDCGLSAPKIASIRDLISQVRDRRLPIADFDSMTDEVIRERLVRVRGIGPWTANMFLIFAMCRPDVLATTDLGIQIAVGRMLKLEHKATPVQVEVAATEGSWHPFASAACLYLWRSLASPIAPRQ